MTPEQITWSTIAYFFVHLTSLWLLIAYFGIALTAWILAKTLDKHNARSREANLARKTAAGYTAAAIILWIFSFIMR